MSPETPSTSFTRSDEEVTADLQENIRQELSVLGSKRRNLLTPRLNLKMSVAR
jgi:hypothetical protein